MRKLSLYLPFLVSVGIAVADEAAQKDFPVDLGLSVDWESRYVSEGRDNLDGDGLASVEAAAGYSGFELGAWAAESPDQDYTEFNYWLAYAYEWEAFTFSFGYTLSYSGTFAQVFVILKQGNMILILNF